MKSFGEYVAVFILSAMFMAFYQFQTDFLPGTDGYYHIKLAYLMREQGFISDFKWAHLSLWRDHFSDKEFLYHVYLIPFTFFQDLAFGGKIATVLMGTFVFTSFYAVLKLNNIKYAWFWLLLLSMTGGYFLYRVNVPRPQGLSILYVIWTIHFLLNRKYIALGVLCFLYTYSYTAWHLPFVFACIAWFYLLLFEKENAWKLPLVTFLAALAGMLLSPFFPNNVNLFYLQNFYILWKGSESAGVMNMGGEFWPMTTKAVMYVNTAVVIPFITAFFVALYAPRKWDKRIIILFLIALSLIFLTTSAKRFAEYSVPVTMMFCAFFFSPYLEKLDLGKLRTFKGALIGLFSAGVLITMSYNSYINTVDEFKNVGPANLEKAALWLKENTEEDEIIFTADWDDAPELFFYNHKNRYLVFLDPNFMYYWDPELWQKWKNLANGHYGKNTYEILKTEFNIRHGVATSDFTALRTVVIQDPRMEIVFDSGGAYVFKLLEEDKPISDPNIN